ncbi:hypothetical protein MMC30_009118 [Trapelia coarctata]|nr:hypothetical protein [Trapelia coarctata]
MNGIRGYSGWRWIFILEGLLTCVIAIIAFVLIADFPESVQWLRTDERAFMKDRLTSENDTEDLGKALTIRHIFLIFKDYKGVLGGLMYFGTAISAYSLAYFTPTIVKSFGYGLITTQLYSVPPYAVAFVTSLAFAFASDKARIRSPFIVLGFGIWLVGIVILLAITTNTHAQYAALFLVAMGTFSSMPIVICWYTMNLQGHFQRSIGTGWIIGCGNIGGIVATFSFTNGNYHTGYGVVLGGLCLSFLTAMLYLVAVSVENRQGWDAHGRVTLGEQAMGDSREKARRNFL